MNRLRPSEAIVLPGPGPKSPQRDNSWDGDGDIDVFSANFNDEGIAWYENSGASPPAWTKRVISGFWVGAWGVHTADLDGDSDIDVISGEWDGLTLAWHENVGGSPAAFTEHVIGICGGAEGIFAARLDGDADVDILCAANPPNKVQLFDNEANYTESDGDGVRDDLDCAPADAAAFAVPGEVRGLRYGAPTLLAWTTEATRSGSSTV